MHEHSDRNIEAGEGAGKWEGRQGVSPTLIGLVVVAVVTIIFIFQNSDKVRVRFLFLDPQTRVWLAIAISIALGVVLDRLFAMWWRRRRER
jgi:uncharacterized integral membrane protein